MVTILNFTQGKRANDYSEPTQQGFNIQGNIGTILNSNECDNKTTGLCINTGNKTENNETMFKEFDTMSVSNGIERSVLLENYPSGPPNMLLGSDFNNNLNGELHPALYGETTYGLNDSKLVSSSSNDIGHEIQAFGKANQYGSRALSQGKYSTEKMLPGYNIPQMDTVYSGDRYIVKTEQEQEDWRNLDNGNHLKRFQDLI